MTNRYLFFFCLGASLVIWAVYGQIMEHSFINFDDTLYITHNQKVQSGLNSLGLSWAFTTPHASNWHPITWISHMLDCQLFGLKAGWHHLVSVLFHLANTVLFFIFFSIATKKLWPSVFISLLFALHPLHVESVAWAAERKDVLSTFWMLLTLITYTQYTRTPGTKNYLGLLLFFILGLLSKPMLVTLPLLLLILDYWPLHRFGTMSRETLQRLIFEKIPLFLAAGLSSLITIIVQQQSGAIKSLQMIPLQLRLENAAISYVSYLFKMIWPMNLSIIYPYPKSIPLLEVIGAIVFVTIITILVFRRRKTQPFLLVGWLWYLSTLIPVIGLIQVGVQAMADRYTYIPLVGIFLMIAFSGEDWRTKDAEARSIREKLALLGGTGILITLALLSWNQVAYWQNSASLFRHSLDISPDNYTAHNYLAQALREEGKTVEAEYHYHESLSIQPNYLESLVNLGVLLAEQGRGEEAQTYLEKAKAIQPHNAKILNNLGNIAKSKEELQKSNRYYRRALAEDPNYEEALFNLANTLEKQNNFPESIVLYSKAIELNPQFAAAYNGLGVVWARKGNLEQAARYFNMAVAVKPNYRQAICNLEKAKKQLAGKQSEAKTPISR